MIKKNNRNSALKIHKSGKNKAINEKSEKPEGLRKEAIIEINSNVPEK